MPDIAWHSPHHRVAFATFSRGFRHIIVWHSPHHRVAFAACSLTLLVDYFKTYF